MTTFVNQSILLLHSFKSATQAAGLARFFKTKEGDYGENDVFIGVTVPKIRQVARKFSKLSLEEIEVLLSSKIHEERLLALIILTEQFKKTTDEKRRKQIFDFYLRHKDRVNNWDLVDTSAPTIVGGFLEGKDHAILIKLAGSDLLWDRRIAVLATFHFIRKNDDSTLLKITKILMRDPHDLIHKAVGWMLREALKREFPNTLSFLNEHYQDMPRTQLRYAIERFPPEVRKKYLERK